MWAIAGKLIDRCFAVLGAFVFCQMPQVMQQYTMVLSGHMAESRREINMLQNVATLGNKTLQEYIQKFLGQQDLDFVRQGEMMQALQARYNELSYTYAALQESTVWSRPFVFLQKLDRELFVETLHEYTPGLSLNLETLVYAIVGLGIGVLTFRLLTKGLKALISLFRKPSKNISGSTSGKP